MGWSYGVPNLSYEEKIHRRQTLDLYARIAHFSPLAPICLFLLVRVVRHLSNRLLRSGSRGDYEQIPTSPVIKARRRSSFGAAAARWQRLRWWSADTVSFAGFDFGRRDQWIFGLIWMAWLLALCFLDTGSDFFHLTKRFGTIAISQFPLHYLLSLKALNPFSWIFRSSHEQINRYHRTLGRIIFALLLVHILLYSSYFIYAGILLKRFLAPIVFCGVLASLAMNAIITTSLTTVRAYSYRLFFLTHLVAALLIPILIFFHAPSARIYLVETLVFFLIDIAYRRWRTVNAPSSLQVIPGTNLVKITSLIPHAMHSRYSSNPGSHVYLNLPDSNVASVSVPSSDKLLLSILFNPLSIASVNDGSSSITLVARVRDGPVTQTLKQIASTPTNSDGGPHNITLAIAGPLGSMNHDFPQLLAWGASRVLLFAGGVGATFAVPIFRALQEKAPATKVQFIWAVRSKNDTLWVVPDSSTGGDSLLDHPDVHFYVTGDEDVEDGTAPAVDRNIGMRDLAEVDDAGQRVSPRPDIEKIVEDTFRLGLEEPVAVLVCGPQGMVKEVRRCVQPWVRRYRQVWWHAESFGW